MSLDAVSRLLGSTALDRESGIRSHTVQTRLEAVCRPAGGGDPVFVGLYAPPATTLVYEESEGQVPYLSALNKRYCTDKDDIDDCPFRSIETVACGTLELVGFDGYIEVTAENHAGRVSSTIRRRVFTPGGELPTGLTAAPILPPVTVLSPEERERVVSCENITDEGPVYCRTDGTQVVDSTSCDFTGPPNRVQTVTPSAVRVVLDSGEIVVVSQYCDQNGAIVKPLCSGGRFTYGDSGVQNRLSPASPPCSGSSGSFCRAGFQFMVRAGAVLTTLFELPPGSDCPTLPSE